MGQASRPLSVARPLRITLAGASAGALLATAFPALATVGYFSNGIGTQAKGIGGAAIAYPKDSLAIASNPASATVLGDRADIGVEWFRPDREASINGNLFGPDQTFDGSGKKDFFIPEIGYVRQLGDRLAVGIAVYGNGGMNTTYEQNPYARFGATGEAGVNLEQLFVSPTIAYELAPGHSVGVSFNLAYQRFSAKGIGIFGGFSQDPAHVSNQGNDDAFGYGFRVGYLGQLAPWVTVGAVYQSKTWSEEFDKYAGLFADQGDFDVPASYGVGVAFHAPHGLDLVGEIQHIEYSEIAAVGNSVSSLFAGQPLGSDDGPGFGWDDVTVFRLGANYQVTPQWQVRGGWAYATQPVQEGETFFNILAPGVVQHHFTLGATWTGASGVEVSAYGLYAPKTTVEGENSIPPGFPPAGLGGGNADVSLSEVAFGLQVGWKFGAR